MEILLVFVPEGPIGPVGPGGPTTVRTGLSSGEKKHTNRHLNSNFGSAQKIMETVVTEMKKEMNLTESW